ncbi:mitotic-spindle organizing gamma-tubulin ring associated-domain-containing protein [Xylariaceae sp. FL0255]|nr:mitotic-spindle organizing gamma-tubulin ring associated-domain-containing protein [Xylariaceae sp. FL0255]
MPPTQSGSSEKDGQAAARQAVDILHEISTILNCQLDRRTLSVCTSMIEAGANPEALATVVQYLRKEAQKVNFADDAAKPSGK